MLPVLGPDGTVVGMITDRDVAIAAATRNRTPALIVVGEVISGTLHFCGPEDELADALETMSLHQVHRLPVLHPDGRVAGLVSLNDVFRYAERVPAGDAIRRLALETASRISAPHGRTPEVPGTGDGKVRRRPARTGKGTVQAGKVPARGKKPRPA